MAKKKRGAKKGRRKKAAGHDDPHRSCIVCRATKTPDELLRFARAADGSVGFDVKAVLPGRGAWVCVAGACLDKALEPKSGKNEVWSRAFDAAVVFDAPALRAQVRSLLMADLLARLGLLRRQGLLVTGRDEVVRKKDNLAFVGLASDLSANSQHEMREALTTTTTLPLPPMEALADALGTRAVGVVGVLKNGSATGLSTSIRRVFGLPFESVASASVQPAAGPTKNEAG